MRRVGIRNLKNQLSKYIGFVREGDVVLVTDRDEVVAQIIPPEHTGADEPSRERAALALMAMQGRLRLGQPGRGGARAPLPPMPRPARASKPSVVPLDRLLRETRRERH